MTINYNIRIEGIQTKLCMKSQNLFFLPMVKWGPQGARSQYLGQLIRPCQPPYWSLQKCVVIPTYCFHQNDLDRNRDEGHHPCYRTEFLNDQLLQASQSSEHPMKKYKPEVDIYLWVMTLTIAEVKSKSTTMYPIMLICFTTCDNVPRIHWRNRAVRKFNNMYYVPIHGRKETTNL